jgi:hypothetical protein
MGVVSLLLDINIARPLPLQAQLFHPPPEGALRNRAMAKLAQVPGQPTHRPDGNWVTEGEWLTPQLPENAGRSNRPGSARPSGTPGILQGFHPTALLETLNPSMHRTRVAVDEAGSGSHTLALHDQAHGQQTLINSHTPGVLERGGQHPQIGLAETHTRGKLGGPHASIYSRQGVAGQNFWLPT